MPPKNSVLQSVVRALAQVIEWRGKPAAIRCDNSPDYISAARLQWVTTAGTEIKQIQPGNSQQNALYAWMTEWKLRPAAATTA